MPTIATKLLFFVSTYVPFLIILAFTSLWNNKPYLFAASSFLFITGVAIVGIYFHIAENSGGACLEIKDIKNISDHNIPLFFSYATPLITLVTDIRNANLAMLFIFGTIYLLVARTDWIKLSPFLAFMGYKLYEITTPNGHRTFLYARPQKRIISRELTKGDRILVESISENLLLEIPVKSK